MPETDTRLHWKRATGYLLLLVALGSLVAGVMREWRAERDAMPAPDIPGDSPVVTVFYFHGNKRCKTCRKIEAEARRVVETRFAKELRQGTLAFETVNFDAPENLHYRDDYELSFSTVLVRGVGSEPQWKNMDAVWDYVNSDAAQFESYLAQGITSMLEGRP